MALEVRPMWDFLMLVNFPYIFLEAEEACLGGVLTNKPYQS